jgi:hypothetical protein
MKNRLHKSITVFIALLVLLSSTGFGFMEHACMMRGKSVKFLSEKRENGCEKKVESSCCAKRKALNESRGTYFKKTDCCKDSQKFEKVDALATQGSLLIKIMKASAGDLLWSVHSFSFLVPQWSHAASNTFPEKPISFSSLFHGRSMCSFVQSFLI